MHIVEYKIEDSTLGVKEQLCWWYISSYVATHKSRALDLLNVKRS